MSKFKIQPEPIEYSYNKAMESIAFEAGFIANAVELAKTYLPSLIKHFKSDTSGIKLQEEKVRELSKSQAVLIASVNSKPYNELADIVLPVPGGFNSNLAKALKTSKVLIKDLENLHAIVEQFFLFTATFLTNKDAKKSTKDLTIFRKEVEKQVNDIKVSISSIFEDSHNNVELKFSQLFTSNNDFKEAVYDHGDVAKLFAKIKPTELKTLLDSTSDNLDDIIRLIKEGKIDNMSPESLKSFASGTYQAAQAAEAYSVTYYRLLTIVNIIPNIERYFKRTSIGNEGIFDIFKKKKKEDEKKEKTIKDILEDLIKEIESNSESKIKVSFNKINKDFDLTTVLKDMDILEKCVEFNYKFVKEAVVWHSRMLNELKKTPIDKDSVLDLYNVINRQADSFILPGLKKIGNFNRPHDENKERVVTNNKTFSISVPKSSLKSSPDLSKLPEYKALVYLPFFWGDLKTDLPLTTDKEIDKKLLLDIFHKALSLTEPWETFLDEGSKYSDYIKLLDISGELQDLSEKIDDEDYSQFAYSIGEEAYQYTFADGYMWVSIMIERFYEHLKLKINK